MVTACRRLESPVRQSLLTAVSIYTDELYLNITHAVVKISALNVSACISLDDCNGKG